MDFDKTKNEFVLQNQQVQSTDKVKVLLEWSCGATAEYAALDGESCATATSTDNVITMNGGYYYDFYFKLDSKLLYVGANTENPANADKYYLVGVDGDWTTGIELEPEGEDKMVKLGQEISKTDQLKIEKRTPCGDALYDGIEVESPVPYYRGENNNIVLEDGTYNFYFDTAEPEKKKMIGFAIASLILGILSVLCCCCTGVSALFGIVGVILGVVTLVKKFAGKGCAIAGAADDHDK